MSKYFETLQTNDEILMCAWKVTYTSVTSAYDTARQRGNPKWMARLVLTNLLLWISMGVSSKLKFQLCRVSHVGQDLDTLNMFKV